MKAHCAIEETMTLSGLRRTDKRHRLLELLAEKWAWSVAELHRALGRGDLSTVYRNVQDLLAKSVIRQVPLPGEEARYELASLPHHAHLVCANCDRAECVPCPVRLRADHSLEMKGLCSLCRRPAK